VRGVSDAVPNAMHLVAQFSPRGSSRVPGSSVIYKLLKNGPYAWSGRKLWLSKQIAMRIRRDDSRPQKKRRFNFQRLRVTAGWVCMNAQGVADRACEREPTRRERRAWME
jgi:hypothetical protein